MVSYVQKNTTLQVDEPNGELKSKLDDETNSELGIDNDDLSEYKEYKAGFREFINALPNITGGSTNSISNNQKALILFADFKNENKISKKNKTKSKTSGGSHKLKNIDSQIKQSKSFDLTEALESNISNAAEEISHSEYSDVND